jgi:hypothetical protein
VTRGVTRGPAPPPPPPRHIPPRSAHKPSFLPLLSSEHSRSPCPLSPRCPCPLVCPINPFLLSQVTDDPGQFAGCRAQFDLTSRWALRGAFLDTVKNIYNRKYCYKYTHQKQRTEEASLVTGTHCSSHQRSRPRACVGPSDSDWIDSPAVIPLPLCL